MSILSTLFKNGHVVLDCPHHQNSQKPKNSESIVRVLHFICNKKSPKKGAFNRVVEKMRFELTTSWLPVKRSSQLSYIPKLFIISELNDFKSLIKIVICTLFAQLGYFNTIIIYVVIIQLYNITTLQHCFYYFNGLKLIKWRNS